MQVESKVCRDCSQYTHFLDCGGFHGTEAHWSNHQLQDTAKRGICIAPLLLQRLSELEYKAVPPGAKS